MALETRAKCSDECKVGRLTREHQIPAGIELQPVVRGTWILCCMLMNQQGPHQQQRAAAQAILQEEAQILSGLLWFFEDPTKYFTSAF